MLGGASPPAFVLRAQWPSQASWREREFRAARLDLGRGVLDAWREPGMRHRIGGHGRDDPPSTQTMDHGAGRDALEVEGDDAGRELFGLRRMDRDLGNGAQSGFSCAARSWVRSATRALPIR